MLVKPYRNIGLDIIRAIAVILVLFRHSTLEGFFLKQFGWLGVDLFFVLSGYLISNLLFREYRENNKIDVLQFLLRRAFRVFPPFYFFIFFTLLITVLFDGIAYVDLFKLFSELFYLQSYLPRIWEHTWSLAVEEHFYVIFSLLLFLIIKRRHLENQRLMIFGMIVLLVLSFFFRFQASEAHRTEEFFGFVKSHLRSDGIIFGVLVSYCVNFYGISDWIHHKRWNLLLISVVTIAPGFYFNGGSFFMNTIGLTLVNGGFAIIVLLAIHFDDFFQKKRAPIVSLFSKLIAFISLSSYSIYLWHLAAKQIVISYFPIELGTILATAAYMGISILFGIMTYFLIEKPSLKLRDHMLKKGDGNQN